jgi:superfamily II DNA or RNA helicase
MIIDLTGNSSGGSRSGSRSVVNLADSNSTAGGRKRAAGRNQAGGRDRAGGRNNIDPVLMRMLENKGFFNANWSNVNNLNFNRPNAAPAPKRRAVDKGKRPVSTPSGSGSRGSGPGSGPSGSGNNNVNAPGPSHRRVRPAAAPARRRATKQPARLANVAGPSAGPAARRLLRVPSRGQRGPAGPATARMRPAELPHARRNAPNAEALNALNADGFRVAFGAFRLKPHQLAVSKLFAKPATKGLLLYYKVGSGKTLAAIAALENLARREGRRRPALVVVPAALRDNFRKELRAAGVDPAARAPDGRGLYTVVSFDAFHRMPVDERLRLARGAVLVVDEAQNLRNPLGAKLASLLAVAGETHKRLLLSGTPVMNYPKDVGPLLALMDPSPEVVRRTVKELRTVRGRQRWVPTFNLRYGKQAQLRRDELDARFRCASLFYEPDERTVRAHYPTKTEHWVPVPMSENQVRAQLTLAEDDAGPETLAELGYDDDVISVFFLTKPREVNTSLGDDSPKIREVVRRVAEAVRAGGRCVVFSSYLQHALYPAARRLRDLGVACSVYEGCTSESNKRRMVEEYNAGRVPVIMLSESGKEGLDLKDTTQVHVVEPAWNAEKIQQVIGRAVRYESHVGPNKHVDVFRYLAVFPPGWERWRTPAQQGGEGVLFRMSADEVLRVITERKNAVNLEFLRRLVAISDRNLAECL